MQSNKPLNVIAFIAIVLLIISQSCANYYQVRKTTKLPSTPDSIVQVYPNRYYILRSNTQALYMSDIKISEDRQSLSCNLDTLPEEHKFHLHRGRSGSMRYRKEQPEAIVLNEIHFFINVSSLIEDFQLFII